MRPFKTRVNSMPHSQTIFLDAANILWLMLFDLNFFAKRRNLKSGLLGDLGNLALAPPWPFFFFFLNISWKFFSFKRPAFKDPMKWKLTVLSWLRSVKPLSYDWLMRHKFRLRRTAKNLKQVVWKGLNPSRSPWLLRVLKFWQYGFYHRRKRESPFQTSAPMTFNFGISGAARSLSFMASSSHFFLQISTCSMQNWGDA